MEADPHTDLPPGGSARILVCEDSRDERLALAHFLRRRGYQVDETGDGRASIQHIKDHEIHAVLLDLMMPDGDGFEVLRYLQEHRRALPVILISGMPPEQIQHKMHRLPKHELPALLIKPIDMNQVLELLELKLSGEIPEFELPAGEEDEPIDRAG
ncbi:MAG TPA: response regulator [Tepidisphaeraceae bacterium]|jgi:DNA-binding response OmpR family regulator